MRVKKESNQESAVLKFGVDDAQRLIGCLPPFGSLAVDLEMFKSPNIRDKLKVIAKFLLPIPVHHPDLPTAVMPDFSSGAKRVGPYIAHEAEARLPEITAYLKVTERKLSKEIDALRRSPDNPSLKDKVKEVERLRLTLETLRTLKRIGEGEVAIEAVPLSNNEETPEIEDYLDSQFRSSTTGTLGFPDGLVAAD
jgi:hypothetical protein